MATSSGGNGGALGFPAPSRAKARKVRRSLGAALRDAGLTGAAPEQRDEDDVLGLLSDSTSALDTSKAIAASRSPRLGVFAEPADEAEHPVVTPASHHSTPQAHATTSVVSPPPWVRAARRGRRHARVMNTFGWMMTIAIAGSIIGLAGRYLAAPSAGVQATMQARQ